MVKLIQRLTVAGFAIWMMQMAADHHSGMQRILVGGFGLLVLLFVLLDTMAEKRDNDQP